MADVAWAVVGFVKRGLKKLLIFIFFNILVKMH